MAEYYMGIKKPTDEEIRLSAQDDLDPAQIDLSAPAGVSIEDPIQPYLKEIAGTPLLTAKEEMELCERLAYGDEDAKQKMTEASLRLVVGIAKQYANRGVPFSDLIQEGNLGLMSAIETFDDQKGYRFRSYANWWIRQSIVKVIEEQTESTQLSAHVVQSINEQNQVSEQLTRDLGRTPTVEEIANRMEVPVDTVQEIQKMAQDAQSLQSQDDEEESEQPEKEQPEEEQPEVEVLDAEGSVSGDMDEQIKEQTPLQEGMEAALSSLTEQEQQVVRMRYGLDHEIPMTPEKVGARLGLSAERVQEIEAAAMQKLQSQDVSSHFQGYVDED